MHTIFLKLGFKYLVVNNNKNYLVHNIAYVAKESPNYCKISKLT